MRLTRREALTTLVGRRQQPDDLGALLAEEHAAIHLYGVLAPRLPDALKGFARGAYDDHRRHRDVLVGLIEGAGGTPPPPLLTYALPDLADPRRTAESIEDSLSVRWHAAVRTATDRFAVAAALADEAAHLAVLRYALRRNVADAVRAFPGR